MIKSNIKANLKAHYSKMIENRVPLKVLTGLTIAGIMGGGIVSAIYSLGLGF